MQRRSIWIAAASLVGIALLLLAWFMLPLREWLQGFAEWARALGGAGVALVSAAYVLATLLLVPGFPMTLAVAIVYGWWALAICFGGGMLSALVAFLVARHLARERVKRLLDRHSAARAVDSVAREETFKTILLARLTPVTPFALENYAFGVTGVRLGAYLAATAVGIVPGTILNVWIGVIGRTAAQGGAGAASWALLVIGLAAAVILSVWLTRRAKQKLQHESAGAG
jgi:uncharacterized membrane protein YdjX (TVP38/TMEM64 family)